GRGMLLEEAFPFRAVGTAHEGERTVDDVGSNVVPDRAGVIRQILLGDADIDPIDAIGMGEAHAAFFPPFSHSGWRASACTRPRSARPRPAHRLRGRGC